MSSWKELASNAGVPGTDAAALVPFILGARDFVLRVLGLAARLGAASEERAGVALFFARAAVGLAALVAAVAFLGEARFLGVGVADSATAADGVSVGAFGFLGMGRSFPQIQTIDATTG